MLLSDEPGLETLTQLTLLFLLLIIDDMYCMGIISAFILSCLV